MDALPQELLDHIMLQLSCYPYDLRACSLVARSWVQPAQRILFREVEVIKITAPLFVKLLKRSPHLAIYVQALSATEKIYTPNDRRFLLSDLTFIVPRLANLRSLSLFPLNFDLDGEQAKRFTSRFHLAPDALLQTLRLRLLYVPPVDVTTTFEDTAWVRAVLSAAADSSVLSSIHLTINCFYGKRIMRYCERIASCLNSMLHKSPPPKLTVLISAPNDAERVKELFEMQLRAFSDRGLLQIM